MTPDRIERDQLVAAPVERVWEYVTRAEHLGRWFADAGATIDLRPGGAITLTWVTFTLTAESETSTRITVVESGFAGLDVPELDQRRIHGEHTDGWAVELGHLAEHA